jgi:predicted nucleic acid-binding Zn ribbon protein
MADHPPRAAGCSGADDDDAGLPDGTPGSDSSEPDYRSPQVADHDATGLTLARSVAKSIGVGSRRRRRARTEQRTRTEPQSSGARPDDRDPQLLAAALDRLVDSKGWSTQISVHTMLARWPALVGPTNAAHSTPVAYRDAVLTVRADSTVWASSLRAMAPQLVAILNTALGDGTVGRVVVHGPDAPSWKKGRLSIRGARGPRDTYG